MYHGVLAVTSSQQLTSSRPPAPCVTVKGHAPGRQRLPSGHKPASSTSDCPNLLPTLVLSFLVFTGINMYLHMRNLTGFSTSCLCPLY
ncbi:hypothetical protein PoB_005315300 [Plakobranchus ocellatus]|uniref:Uncharacterized protein n=1 Tax=Plakobranchus ocellatus TaxID=259542 RepID=A0AAV4C406_9GAST|nr:hypothetical protein PoB_005315300 [Plakobranchus ocellatus]